MDKEALYKAWKEEEAKLRLKAGIFRTLKIAMRKSKSSLGIFAKSSKTICEMRWSSSIWKQGWWVLLSLGHLYSMTTAIEAYPPNVELCQHVLTPLGIDFHAADGGEPLPFPDESFDIITNRHGDYDISEIYRTLKPAGFFITQQVGAENDRDLVNLLQPELTELPFPEQYLSIQEKTFRKQGFKILESAESYPAIRFFDVGALVWFAKIIAWEFIDFSVDHSLNQLYKEQAIIYEQGYLSGKTHRFYLVAKKNSKLALKNS